jgi:hypothetical protein
MVGQSNPILQLRHNAWKTAYNSAEFYAELHAVLHAVLCADDSTFDCFVRNFTESRVILLVTTEQGVPPRRHTMRKSR